MVGFYLRLSSHWEPAFAISIVYLFFPPHQLIAALHWQALCAGHTQSVPTSPDRQIIAAHRGRQRCDPMVIDLSWTRKALPSMISRLPRSEAIESARELMAAGMWRKVGSASSEAWRFAMRPALRCSFSVPRGHRPQPSQAPVAAGCNAMPIPKAGPYLQ